jgi:hypothetical protein
MKKNNAWKRKRQAIRNKKLKHKHQLKRLPQRSYNNLNANERSFYADDYALGARQRKYREENREKLKAYHRKYHEENREKLLAKQRKYHEENREKQTRTDILKRLLAGKTVSKSEMIYLRR